MAKKRPDVSKKKGLPLWGSISIIVVLGLVALTLVYVALQQVRKSDENQGFSTLKSIESEPTVTEEAAVEETVVTTEEVTSEAEAASASLELVAPKRLIALDGNYAVRSTVGECTVPGSIEFSQDGGSTWNASAAFEQTSATQVLRILPSASATTFVVALNSDCQPQIYSTANDGESWNGPVSAVGTWYLNPANPREAGAPGGTRTLACDAVALSPVTDSNVGVLCSNGSVISTTDGGASWSDPVAPDGVLALAYSKEQILLAQQGGEGCAGISLGDSCIEADTSSIASVELAFAQSGAYQVAWLGENFRTSRDSGQTWQ